MTIMLAALCILVAVGAMVGVARRRSIAAGQRGREAGPEAFSLSLGRRSDDVIAAALYRALAVQGRELHAVRADDDLGRIYGIVEDDLDDIVVDVLRAATDVEARHLQGVHVTLRTPREIAAFVESLAVQSGRKLEDDGRPGPPS